MSDAHVLGNGEPSGPPPGMLTLSEMNTLKNLLNGLSLTSVVLCGLVLLLFAVVPEKRRTTAQLITLSFCVCGFGINLTLLIPFFFGGQRHVFTHKHLCHFQAAMLQGFGNGAIAFWGALTANLYHTVVFRMRRMQSRLQMDHRGWMLSSRAQLLCCYGYAVVMTLIPMIAGKYGPHDDMYCWIRSGVGIESRSQWDWILGALYFEMAVILVLGLLAWAHIVYVVIRIKMRAAPDPEEQPLTLRATDYSTASTPTSPAFATAASSHSRIAFVRVFEQVPLARYALFVVWFLLVFAIMFSNETVMWVRNHMYYRLWIAHICAVGGIGISCFVTVGLSRKNARLLAARLFCRPSSSSA